MGLWTFFLAYGALQGCFLAIAIYRTRHENRYLAWLILVLSFISFEYAMVNFGFYIDYPIILYLTAPFWYLIFPLWYFYVRTAGGQSINPWHLTVHLLPFGIAFCYNVPFVLLDPTQKIEYVTQYSMTGEVVVSHVIFKTLYYTQSAIYLLYFWVIFFRKRADDPVTPWNICTMRAMLYAMTIYWFVVLLQFVLHVGFKIIWSVPTYAVLSFFTIFIQCVAFYSIRFRKNGFLIAEEKRKYSSSNLHGLQVSELKERLEVLLIREKLFAKTSLKSQDLAKALQISTHQLSELINKELQVSFHDLINSYRVAEAKRLLVDSRSKRLSVLGVGIEAGFNSSASFYRAFKKSTGLSPAQFSKQINS